MTFGHGYNYLKGSHMEKAGGINTLNTLFFHTQLYFPCSPLVKPNQKPEGNGVLLMQGLSVFRYADKGRRGVKSTYVHVYWEGIPTNKGEDKSFSSQCLII